jgi:RNA polymerase sigma-70 factor (ECF subfamily)
VADRPLSDLLRDARTGDGEAVAEICTLFYPKVLTYMRYRVDAASADDLAGEVFLRVLRHIGEQKGSFVAWLYRIAANVVVDHVRSQAARKEKDLREDTADTVDATATLPGVSDRRMDLAQAVADLTDDQRELITLKFIEGLSNAEIAEATGRSAEAVRALQFRALIALREILDKPAEGEGR